MDFAQIRRGLVDQALLTDYAKDCDQQKQRWQQGQQAVLSQGRGVVIHRVGVKARPRQFEVAPEDDRALGVRIALSRPR